MQTQTKFCLCFAKVNTNFFSAVPTLSLILLVSPSPDNKKLFFDYQCEMMKYYQH